MGRRSVLLLAMVGVSLAAWLALDGPVDLAGQPAAPAGSASQVQVAAASQPIAIPASQPTAVALAEQAAASETSAQPSAPFIGQRKEVPKLQDLHDTLPAFHAELENQPRDEAWATRAEAQIRKVLDRTPDIEVFWLECRSSLCEVQYTRPLSEVLAESGSSDLQAFRGEDDFMPSSGFGSTRSGRYAAVQYLRRIERVVQASRRDKQP